MSSPRHGHHVDPALLAALAVALLVAGAGLPDGDLWWHLSVGRFLLDHGTLPWVDPFAFVTDGGTWTPHSGLFAVLLELCYRFAGLAGVRAFRGLLVGGLVLAQDRLLDRWLPARPRARALLAVSVVLPMLPMARPRPYWISLVAVTWCWRWIDATLRDPEPPALARYLVPCFLWAQCHASVLLGLGMPLLALLDARGRPGRARRLGLAAGGAALLSLATPNHVHLWGYWWAHLPQPFFANLIHEWSPPQLGGATLMAQLFLLVTGVMILTRRRRAPWWELVWAVTWLTSFLRHLRWVGMACLAMGTLAAQVVADAEPAGGGPGPPAHPGHPGRALLLAGALLLWARLEAPPFGPPHVGQAALPTASIDAFLATTRCRRLFAPDPWGGYLSWASHHRVPAFLDNRNDLYGPAPIRDYLEILEGAPGWRQAWSRWRFDGALLPRGWEGLARRLGALPGWREAPAPGPALRLFLPEGAGAARGDLRR